MLYWWFLSSHHSDLVFYPLKSKPHVDEQSTWGFLFGENIMTQFTEVLEDPRYVRYLDYGFVGLLSVMRR
jgi:hypothetical protein